MAKHSYDELVQLHQDKKINNLQFVMLSDDAEDFTDWCKAHGVEPSDEVAEFYIEMTMVTAEEYEQLDAISRELL